MNGQVRRISATALALAMLVVSAIAPAVSAAPPDWNMPITVLSPMVKAGNHAGFHVQIQNNGTSNIAQLYLTWNKTDAPSHIGVPVYTNTDNAGDVCERDGVGPLYCYFGALRAGGSIDLVVGYRVPDGSSKLDLMFQANTNGATFADNKGGKPGTSRGDTLNGVYDRPVVINNSADFGGGWVVGSTLVSNDTNIGRRNIQSTQVVAPSTLIPVTVEDGLADDAYSCGTLAECASRFGEWSRVNVDDGTAFAPFRITIAIVGNQVPGGVGTDDIVVIHVLDDGTSELIDTACTFAGGATAPSNAECLVVERVGPNYRIDIWVFHNGAFRPGAV